MCFLVLQICESINGVSVECASPLTQHVTSHMTSHCWVFVIKSVCLFVCFVFKQTIGEIDAAVAEKSRDILSFGNVLYVI